VQKAWDPLVAEHFRRLDVYTLVIVIGAFNLFTDIILLLLPVPVVSKLHTNRKRKGMFFWLYIVLNLSQGFFFRNACSLCPLFPSENTLRGTGKKISCRRFLFATNKTNLEKHSRPHRAFLAGCAWHGPDRCSLVENGRRGAAAAPTRGGSWQLRRARH
jgi:hypothetical protein